MYLCLVRLNKIKLKKFHHFFQTVDCDKILGTKLSISTEEGNINVDSLYVDKTDLETRTADVRVGDCHRTSHVKVIEKGDVTISKILFLQYNLLVMVKIWHAWFE